MENPIMWIAAFKLIECFMHFHDDEEKMKIVHFVIEMFAINAQT